ncbi:major facilitator superfamily domain-containing protein [Mycotypha africana]|uniref:major facilitator superfamily domain-containing protein n=1 Tax=Mycotypha africana TaxID=64632 RepID=UPI0023008187|nr:major facilitator superfamily domain-containing protein [Mycotypha africana]KAI8971648.1 major facilitator superfamily domain-containing protein [Mycotypha africana]
MSTPNSESIHSSSKSSDENTAMPNSRSIVVDPIVEKRLLRKLDFRLITFAFFSYFTSNLVRNNMQQAYTNGMDKDVHINSEAYNWCVTFFFIGYVVPQIPTNMVVARLLPRYFLPTAEVVWGVVTCCIAVAKSANAVWGLRFIQGLAQATFVPSMVFIIGTWYTSSELATRTAFFMAGNQMSGAIGGILAAGINDHLKGALGRASWQWLFIIEGLMSIFVGVIGYWLLPNYPHNTGWIKGEERECAFARLEAQGKQIKSEKYTLDTFRNVLATPYAYILTIDFICINIGNQFILNFSIIIRDLGWSADMSNYLLAPIYGFAAFTVILIGHLSDKYKERAWIIIIVQIWVSVWYLILFAVRGGDTPFWLVMLAAFAIVNNISMFPILFSFMNEIFALDTNTRALAIGCINCIGNLIPNFISVGIWKVSDSPKFFIGKVGTFALSVASIIITFACWWCLKHEINLPRVRTPPEPDFMEEGFPEEKK